MRTRTRNRSGSQHRLKRSLPRRARQRRFGDPTSMMGTAPPEPATNVVKRPKKEFRRRPASLLRR